MPDIAALSDWFNVRRGDPAFIIGTHAYDWFDLGVREGTNYWLQVEIVNGTEFLFNGRLFLPTPGHGGTIIDNFPKGPIPDGWTKRSHVDSTGYDLVSWNGTVLFGYRAACYLIAGLQKESLVGLVTVNIYAADGGLVAESLPNRFVLLRHPATIGRGETYFV
jgi:hypothetical protein